MAGNEHHYKVTVEWTGNRGTGTSGYRDYGREYTIRTEGKPDIAGSADPAFLGDPARWNPEDLLVASVSACHKLWYLHLCAVAGIRVLSYVDHAEGTMISDARGGRFSGMVLKPHIVIAEGGNRDKALALHHDAHDKCFIASSVNFPIGCEPVIEFG